MVFLRQGAKGKWFFRSSVIFLAGLAVLLLINFSLEVLGRGRLEARADIKYYYNVVSEDPVVALTFDDGPDPIKTREIIEVLDRRGVPATFFFIGADALRYPDVVEEVHDAGFEIGNHTFTHSSKVHVSQRRLKFELNVTNKIIEDITGESTKLYRPPYLLDIGSDPLPDPETPRESLSWALQNGYIPVGVDIDSKDWRAKSAQDVMDKFMSDLPNGHIALFHDGGDASYTVEALDMIITELESRGYKFVALQEIIGLGFEKQIMISQNLKQGMSDEGTEREVTALQTFLLKEGLFRYEVTGVFDSITEDALKEWQIQNDVVTEIGFVGPLTREKIKSSLASNGYPVQSRGGLFKYSASGGHLQRFSIFLSSAVGRGLVLASVAILVLAVLRMLVVLSLSLIAAGKRRQVSNPYKEPVSVIVPAYNEEENIRATLESIIGNGDIVREIIVVNDGSHDNTVQIVESVRRKYPNKIKVISINNGGKARALNVGLKETVSDIVVTTDADSIFDVSALNKLVAHFSDSRVGAVAGKICITDSGTLLNAFQYLEYTVGQNLDKRAFSILNAVAIVPGPIGAWRKSDILEVGGYSQDTLVEDQDLTLAILAAGKKVVYEPTALSYTEAPHTVLDFIKQRFRWIFGTVQCTWKYKSYVFSFKAWSLGWIILPHTFVFGIFLPLIYPVMSTLLVLSLVFSFLREVLAVYLIFLMFDFIYAAFGFIKERGRLYSLGLLPLQRVFYHLIIYYVVVRSVMKAVDGSEALWSKVHKRGEVQNLQLQMESRGET